MDTLWSNTWISDHLWIAVIIEMSTLFMLAYTLKWIAQGYMLSLLQKTVEKSKNSWDDAFLEARLFHRLVLIVPLLVISFGIQFAPATSTYPDIEPLCLNICSALMALITILAGLSVTRAANIIYVNRKGGARHPIKSYLQVVNIFVCVIGLIFTISFLLGTSAWGFITGIGAMTAVLMLIFKDTILSVVASIQLSSNKMIKIGDWIEMPQYGADGDVIDVALHTVKIQNWDKTISTIPTHALIDSSFKNWSGMSESGARRIKRSININMNSIHFLDTDEIADLQQFDILKTYLTGKCEELNGHNSTQTENNTFVANNRRLTNIGTLRHYMKEYLKTKPYIHPDMTFLIRQLAPSSHGVPIEIYIFSNVIAWIDYEDIQGDIFDHLLAILPEFGLSAFQEPSGHDFASLTQPTHE